MKKLSKVLGVITCAFVLLLTGMSLTACSFGSKPTLELYHSFKTEYAVGESLDVTGGVLLYTKSGEERHVNIEDSMVVNFNTETSGSKKMFISYKDCEITVHYTVYDDIECESVVYCANPSYLEKGVADANKYDYFFFKSKTELLSISTNVNTSNIDKNYLAKGTNIAVTSSMVNGKKVYVGTISGTTNQIIITVISASKINVIIKSDAITLDYEASKFTLN